MKIHQMSIADAIASLNSRQTGLSHVEANQRLREFGVNRVKKIAAEPAILRLAREFVRFFSLILWLAAGLAFLAEWSAPGQGMAKLGYVLIVVILVSGAFSFWQEYRAEQTLAALLELLPEHVNAVREGEMIPLPAAELVPGDIIFLEQGDHVPADCRLIEAFSVRVNNATITGESLPQERGAAPSMADDILQSKSVLLAGTSILSGQAKAIVFTTGMNTEFGKIAHLTQTGGDVVSPLRKEIAHLSRVIIVLALLIGLVFFAIGQVIGVPFWQDYIFAIGIIVAMVPEGLLPTLTLALVLAAQRMAKRNVLIRHLPSVETLGSTTVICTDKTGTLTQNRMVVKQVLLGAAITVAPDAEAMPQLVERYRHFFQNARLCHGLKEGSGKGKSALLGDPTEIALCEMGQKILPDISTESPIWHRVDEIPFDADRMRASTVYETPEGPTLFCKGAPETVIPLCGQILVDGELRQFNSILRDQVHAEQNAMTERGLRVLAFAHRKLDPHWERDQLEHNLIFAGLVGLEDPPRPEVHEAIRKCREAGIKVIMVTGDHPGTAKAIAREIGLVESQNPVVLTGLELAGLSNSQLRIALDAPEIIFARVTADQKMQIVDALKQKQHVVAVTGDGVNDAPALKSAHIGIAMGISGTDVAKEAADMVLLDDNFASIVSAIEEGRAVFENIQKFLAYIFTHNVAELIPYLGFALFSIPLALTPIQALSIDMGTDSLTALGLGVEKPDPQVMQRPPRLHNERLLDFSLGLRAYLFLGMIEAAAAMTAFFFVLHEAGWTYGQTLAYTDPIYLQSTTACLSAIIVLQIVNVFLCRSATRSIFSTGFSGNKLILFGVLLEVVLLILINDTALGNKLLGTLPIAGNVWVLIIPFALGMLLLEEGRKWIVRKKISDKLFVRRVS